MAITSQVRIRQINQQELSGFLSGAIPTIFSGTGLQLGGNLTPTGNNIFSLGQPGLYWSNIYTNQISIPSGSAINFGTTPFTAYMSGGNGIVSIGGLTISTNSSLVGIIGPQGPSGVTGATGIQGFSGIGITGYSNVNNKLVFYYSNGASGTGIILPSGATGPTGASATGTYQSGNYVSFIFSNGSTGQSFFLPSGSQGLQGPVGNIYIDMQTLTGFQTGASSPLPQVYIPNLYPTITENPPMNLVMGMNYGFGYSGLATSIISGVPTNYYVDAFGQTGYLQLVFFSNFATTGRYVSGESLLPYSTVYNWLDINNNPISNNKIYNTGTLNSMSMNVAFTADSSYYYGFQRYSVATQTPIDGTLIPGEWGFYVCGPINCNFFGPPGPSGTQGTAGIPGPQGETGPPGIDGVQGTSVTGVSSNGTTLQFLFSDGNSSSPIIIPSGGPSGSMGLTGPIGPTGLQGIQGPTGAIGLADTYATEFYPNTMTISGFTGFYKQVSGTSPYIECTGTGMIMQPGDTIYFTTPSLVGKAYTPWQTIMFADNNFYNARYFFAEVITFNENNGAMQCVINSTPSPVGTVGGFIQLWNYSLITVNLGGIGSSGAPGPTGPQGPMGNTGHSIFQNTTANVAGYSTINVSGSSFDSWNIGIVNPANTINLISLGINTGQTFIIKVTNTGGYSDYSDGINPLLYWQIDGAVPVKWPNGVPAPGPNPSTASIYTFIRFPNTGGTSPLIFSTFSTNYPN